MSRKLASIQCIKDLQPIPKADRIEVATIQGWQVVVQKGLYEVGDLVVYFEIDSVLPEEPWCEFMRSRKFRVRTIKLRKQISQGLCVPIEEIPGVSSGLSEGTDLTDTIGVKKHDPQGDRERKAHSVSKRNPPPHAWMLRTSLGRWAHQKLYPRASGSWPEWFPKTDETRIQNLPNIDYLVKNRAMYVTEKLDGQSVTIFYNRLYKTGLFSKGLFGVCSRNIWYKTEISNNWWNIAKDLEIEKKLKDYCLLHKRSLALQGEIIGKGIQGDRYNRGNHEVYFFNVYDIEEGCYIDFIEKQKILLDLGLSSVPILSPSLSLYEGYDYLGSAEGESLLYKVTREGVVYRDLHDDSFSFKAISNKFLLEGGD